MAPKAGKDREGGNLHRPERSKSRLREGRQKMREDLVALKKRGALSIGRPPMAGA